MPWPRLTFVPEAEERKKLTKVQLRYVDDKDLKFWTNFALLIAVLAGLIVAACHQGVITASITAFAGALGLGGVLGFLFGVPVPRSSGAAGTAPAPAAPPATPATPSAPVTPPKPEVVAQALQPPIGIVPLDNGPNPVNVDAPKTETPPAETPKDTSSSQPKARSTGTSSLPSNLEQVADWVTKLLLGGGLTQISKIAPKVWQWSYAVAIGISGDDGKPAAPALVAANQSFAAGLMVYGFVLGFFAGFLITKIQLGKAISS